jgi:hypothetical protein
MNTTASSHRHRSWEPAPERDSRSRWARRPGATAGALIGAALLALGACGDGTGPRTTSALELAVSSSTPVAPSSARPSRALRVHLKSPSAGGHAAGSTGPKSPSPFDSSVNPGGSHHLSYHGGRVLSHVSVVQVFWPGPSGVSSVGFTQMPIIVPRIVESAEMDWLSEYSAQLQPIGRGTNQGGFFISPTNNSQTLVHGSIELELQHQIDMGVLPPPDANTLYMVSFGPQITIIDDDGHLSCQDFCAFHTNMSLNGVDAAVGIIPDLDEGGGCDVGCGPSPNLADNATSVMGHELIESVTDPDGNAWWDSNDGKEIADICTPYSNPALQNTIPGTESVVQLEWSNRFNLCTLGFQTGSLVGGDSGKCADLPAGDTDDGTPVVLYQCNWGSNQLWTTTSATELRTVGDKCMDLPRGDTTEGAGIAYYSCNGGTNQQWRFTRAEVRGLADRCMDLRGNNAADTTPIQVYGCNNSGAQQWTFTPQGEIRGSGNKCIDVPHGNTDDGTLVQLYTCNGGSNQQWTVMPGGQIVGVGGKCLEVPNFNAGDNTQLAISTCTGELNQRWMINGPLESVGDKCLDAPGSSDGLQLDYTSCNGLRRQRWYLF